MPSINGDDDSEFAPRFSFPYDTTFFFFFSRYGDEGFKNVLAVYLHKKIHGVSYRGNLPVPGLCFLWFF